MKKDDTRAEKGNKEGIKERIKIHFASSCRSFPVVPYRGATGR
jgi:hypothetical protein